MLRFADNQKVIEINSDLLKPFTGQIAELIAAKSGRVVEVVNRAPSTFAGYTADLVNANLDNYAINMTNT